MIDHDSATRADNPQMDAASRPGDAADAQARFVSSPGQIAAVLYATSLAVVMLNIAPAMELQFQREAGLSTGQIGTLYFVELAAMGLATFPAFAWLGKVCPSRVARASYALFVAGSALSALALHSFPLLLAARGLTGAGAGTLMILGMTAGARARNPNRMYAAIAFVQLGSGALILAWLPELSVKGSGLRGLFCLCAALGAFGLLLARTFAAAGHGSVPTESRGLQITRAELKNLMLAISFAMVFNLVVGGVWSFAAEYASRVGLSHPHIAMVLMQATVVGMSGAAAAFAIGDRATRRHLLLTGYVIILCGVGILHLVPGDSGFAAGCYVLSFGWNFSVPFVFAQVAAQDRGGRAVSSMNLAFAAGLATGPLLAGAVIEFVGLDALAPCALGGMALGTWLMLRVTRQTLKSLD